MIYVLILITTLSSGEATVDIRDYDLTQEDCFGMLDAQGPALKSNEVLACAPL